MKRAIFLFLTFLFATISSKSIAQETPIILEVEAVFDDQRISPTGDTLLIKGLNFGVLTEPRVVLTTDLTTDLEIVDFTDTEILAVCPSRNCPIGTNVVVAVLDDTESVSFFNTRMVSFGSVGPQGPQGLQGPKGDPGESNDFLEQVYPLGSIYVNASTDTNPATLLGFGNWESFGAGRVMVGLDASDVLLDTALETGGSKTHTLSEAETPLKSHSHVIGEGVINIDGAGSGTTVSVLSGSSVPPSISSEAFGDISVTAHNIMQPYIVVHMWRRTD